MKGYRTLLAMLASAVPPILDVAVPILVMPEWQDIIPNEWWPFYSIGVAALGGLLRLVTTTPVGRKE